MKPTRTIKTVLLATVGLALLGWFAAEFTGPPKKGRAQRIHSQHNSVTVPIAQPAQTAPAPPAPGVE